MANASHHRYPKFIYNHTRSEKKYYTTFLTKSIDILFY